MSILKQTAVAALFFSIIGISACSTTSSTLTEATPEQKNQQELKDITLSEKTKTLLATETDEDAIREELICKREKQIGTHFKKKVCWTKAELEAMRAESKKSMHQMQNGSLRNKGIKSGINNPVQTGN